MSKKLPSLFGKGKILAWMTLLVCLSLTALVWTGLSGQRAKMADVQFDLHVREFIAVLQKRLHDHEQTLLGVSGFFDASEYVSREEWNAYMEHLHLEENDMGMQAIGFARIVQLADLPTHIAAVHSDGHPEFMVWPAGERLVYTPIIYVSPFAGRNLKAFGYDMYSEPARRKAMQLAVHTGKPAITGRLSLVQGTPAQQQAGFLMYVPIYHPGMPTGSAEERWRALKGFVYCAYDIDNLMLDILGKEDRLIDFTLYDGKEATAATLLYDTRLGHDNKTAAQHMSIRKMPLYGNVWTISSRSRAAFDDSFSSPLDWLVPVAGSLISLLLFALVWLLLGRRSRALLLAERKLLVKDAAIESSVNAMVIIGLDGKLTYVNQAFVDLWQLVSPNEAIGHRYSEFWGNAEENTLVKQALLSHGRWQGELRVPLPSGVVANLQLTASLVKNELGQPLCVLGSFVDITESLKNQNALLKAKEQAEAANRAKSEFLSVMSHEIRTPMNSVIGMAYLALDTNLDARQRDYVKKIYLSGQHLLALIDNILDFSKIEKGKLVLEQIDFSLDTVFDTVRTLLDDRAAEKQIGLTVEIADDITRELKGDPLRLTQILINYVSNAIKFSENSMISVRVWAIDNHPHDCLLRFEVKDNGIGLTTAEQAKIFQPFLQADSSTTRKFGGSGLGLVICKELAQLMGGTVGVISEYGVGSTFWFTAHFAKADDASSVKRENRSVSSNRNSALIFAGVKILLAEDNTFNQQLGSELLSRAGAQVTIANNGHEALKCLQQDVFDCVLMDLHMPEMDGLEATRLIRQNPATMKIPVIAMTASALEEVKEQCLAAGMNGFISKPINPSSMYAILSQWIHK